MHTVRAETVGSGMLPGYDVGERMRTWRAFAILTVATLAFGMSEAVADSPPVELDLPRNPVPLQDAVATVEGACASTGHLSVRLVTADGESTTDFDCARILGDPEAVAKQLLSRVGRANSAREKASRVAAIQRSLPPEENPTYDEAEMIWSFASGNPKTCSRAGRPRAIRQNMKIAAVANRETPERWTLIEAVMLAGACPHRLPVLFRNVRRIGEATAAKQVERRIERALRTI